MLQQSFDVKIAESIFKAFLDHTLVKSGKFLKADGLSVLCQPFGAYF